MGSEKHIHEADIIIGKNIAAQRQLKGFSQEELGALMLPTRTFQQIGKYESAENRVSGSAVAEICKALNITAAEIFAGTDAMIVDGQLVSTLTKRELLILGGIRRIKNPEHLTLLRHVITAMTSGKNITSHLDEVRSGKGN